MHTLRLVLTAILALTVSAAPLNETNLFSSIVARGKELHAAKRAASRFNVQVWNNCPFVKEFAMYQVTPEFTMLQKSKPVNIQPGGSHIFHPRFKAEGMRLSGHAEWGTGGQWQPQALFEFSYSTYAGVEGTAYDASVMEGSDPDIGIGIYPHNDQCRVQQCWPWSCPPDQGWTTPDQVNIGSPADTVCYQGKTDFDIVFCP